MQRQNLNITDPSKCCSMKHYFEPSIYDGLGWRATQTAKKANKTGAISFTSGINYNATPVTENFQHYPYVQASEYSKVQENCKEDFQMNKVIQLFCVQ